MEDISAIRASLASLTVYSKVSEADLFKNFINLVDSILNNDSFNSVVSKYSKFVNSIYNSDYSSSLSDYVKSLVLCDMNIFSLSCAKGAVSSLDKHILSAAEADISVLNTLSSLKVIDLQAFIKNYYPDNAAIIDNLPLYTASSCSFSFDDVKNFHKVNGVGIFARYNAFKFNSSKELEPILNCDTIKFTDLKHYKEEQNIVKDNTLAFIKNKPYNNVLLYGDRGTGKSSTVKALLNEYAKDGLRIIQVYKENLHLLDALMASITEIPMKFIVFIDDLTFSENDDNFTALKAILEGSVAKQPDNMVIYATTNRRHLVRESFSARQGDEVHLADTIDETVSLSDRFGILVTYSIPNKDKYLEIVEALKTDRQLNIADDALFKKAERFALLKGNRSPRVAKQFIDDLQAKIELNLAF